MGKNKDRKFVSIIVEIEEADHIALSHLATNLGIRPSTLIAKAIRRYIYSYDDNKLPVVLRIYKRWVKMVHKEDLVGEQNG